MPGGAQTVRDLVDAGEKSFSFEFFPPNDEAGERQLWKALRELESLHPTFVSVTYGAGGSTRDRTVRITGRISEETTLTAVGHLTCVAASRTARHNVASPASSRGGKNSKEYERLPAASRSRIASARRIAMPRQASRRGVPDTFFVKASTCPSDPEMRE